MKSTETLRVVPARYPLRLVGAAIALFILAVVIQSVAFNPRWEWSVFAHWFFHPAILSGLGQTLLLTLIASVLSIVLGVGLALARSPLPGCSPGWRSAISGCSARCR